MPGIKYTATATGTHHTTTGADRAMECSPGVLDASRNLQSVFINGINHSIGRTQQLADV